MCQEGRGEAPGSVFRGGGAACDMLQVIGMNRADRKRPLRPILGAAMPDGTPADCPLCEGKSLRPLSTVGGRSYVECSSCGLVHLAPGLRLPPSEERAHYETHQNAIHDPRYRAFLNRLAAPLTLRLEPGARGLDYGAGTGPALAALLGEQGFPTAVYDPFFWPDETALRETYDFVTCTEAVEHFFRPGEELARLSGLVRPGGILALMTELLTDEIDFTGWWYPRDPTHVSFFRPKTMAWIARCFGWSMEQPARGVVLFRTAPARALGPVPGSVVIPPSPGR